MILTATAPTKAINRKARATPPSYWAFKSYQNMGYTATAEVPAAVAMWAIVMTQYTLIAKSCLSSTPHSSRPVAATSSSELLDEEEPSLSFFFFFPWISSSPALIAYALLTTYY